MLSLRIKWQEQSDSYAGLNHRSHAWKSGGSIQEMHMQEFHCRWSLILSLPRHPDLAFQWLPFWEALSLYLQMFWRNYPISGLHIVDRINQYTEETKTFLKWQFKKLKIIKVQGAWIWWEEKESIVLQYKFMWILWSESNKREL